MDDLALQVAEIHHIKINQPNTTNSSGCEIETQWSSQTSRANQKHLGGLELLLSFHADFRHDQMPAIARYLIVAQLHAGKCFLTRCYVAACDRRDDTDDITVLERGFIVLQIADVFVVNIHIDEIAELSLGVIKVL